MSAEEVAAEAQSHLSIPQPQALTLLNSFTHFLTVAIHNILYYRCLYPQPTFLTARAYNLPVHQSRHPQVCNWIRDAVDAVNAQLVLGAVERIAIVIYDGQNRVMERWMIDVTAFPAWAGMKEAIGKDGVREEDDDGGGPGPDAEVSTVNWTNVDEGLRAAVRRMAYAAEKMASLPDGCTFTVAIELRDEAEAPIRHPQYWLPSQPNLQTKSGDRQKAGEDVGGAKTMPLRTVEAGPLFFECWVEVGRVKPDQGSTESSR